ncbi:MAG: DUF1292 domain-containing protein [Clostridia bacterium]|nr:DUF1292 domain-containing protein [Clostridia bacterium]
MEENERDVVVFVDENDNEVELDLIRYFEHKGQEYAILMDFNAGEGCGCGHDHEHHHHEDECGCGHDHSREDGLEDVEMYIMKVVINGEYEEFVPPEEEIFEELIEVVENLPDEEE